MGFAGPLHGILAAVKHGQRSEKARTGAAVGAVMGGVLGAVGGPVGAATLASFGAGIGANIGAMNHPKAKSDGHR